jgi:hypothetical protein
MQNSTFRKTIEFLFVTGGFIIALAIVINLFPRKGDVIVINCDISEISPDFTVSMREACREARANIISKDLQKPK